MNKIPYRQIHLDFHTSPFIDDVGTEFDAKEFVNTLKMAKVNSINVFAKCHNGNCYYPTKLGKVHPSLKFDMLGGMIKACHTEGIKAPIYIPIGWEETSADHPEWLEVNMDGILGGKRPFEEGYYRWRKLCHNKEGYVKFIEAQLQELLDLYEVDGFWIDIVFQTQCVCNECMKEIKEMKLDPKNVDHVKKHDFIVIKRFMNRIYEYIKARKSEATVFFNMSIAPDGGYEKEFSIREKTDFMTQIEIESLPSGLWGYNHFPLFANYYNTFDKPLLGMNGKFHKAWGDFGSIRNREALEFECFRMIASGAGCSIGDQLHPRGRMNETVYKRIGEVYSQIEERESWLFDSKKLSEIGILFNNKPLYEEFGADEGIMRILLELHKGFDFIDRVSEFDRYRLIILPDEVYFDEELTTKISRYIEKGGKILASYKSGMDKDEKQFLFKECGVEFEGDNPYCPSYLRLSEEFEGSIEKEDYVMYERGLKVKAVKGTKILGKVVNPYFNRSYDRFTSHCQFPPDKLTDCPGVTKNNNVIYIAYPIFYDYIENGNKVYRDIVENAINNLLQEELLYTNLPTTAETYLRKQGKRTILHIIHYISQKKSRNIELVDSKIPLHDISFKVKCENKPEKVYMAPSLKEIPFKFENGYVEGTITKIIGHEMLVIE